jgi:hypothetical protein
VERANQLHLAARSALLHEPIVWGNPSSAPCGPMPREEGVQVESGACPGIEVQRALSVELAERRYPSSRGGQAGAQRALYPEVSVDGAGVPSPLRGATMATFSNSLRKTGGLLLVAGALTAFTSNDAAQPKTGPRYGAICNDGWPSPATGSGACSHHHGVDHWLTDDGPAGNPNGGYVAAGGLAGVGTITWLIGVGTGRQWRAVAASGDDTPVEPRRSSDDDTPVAPERPDRRSYRMRRSRRRRGGTH